MKKGLKSRLEYPLPEPPKIFPAIYLPLECKQLLEDIRNSQINGGWSGWTKDVEVLISMGLLTESSSLTELGKHCQIKRLPRWKRFCDFLKSLIKDLYYET